MNWLKQKIEGREQFLKVLAGAIAVNIGLLFLLALISYGIKDITVTVNGKTAKYKTVVADVDALLRYWNVNLKEKDSIEYGRSDKLKDGTKINIDIYKVVNETVNEDTDFKISKSYTSELLEGKKKVTREGVKGQDRVTYSVAYLGQRELKREEISRKTIRKPVIEKVSIGTAVAYNGERYSRKITVVSTGYTHTGHRTATGTYPHRGTMAVDRSVISMGSYGYVPGYGKVHAEDTGGAIRGNRVDLFFESRGQAVSWGRRTVTLYIK